ELSNARISLEAPKDRGTQRPRHPKTEAPEDRGVQRSRSPATRSPHQWPPISPTVAPKAPRVHRTRQPDLQNGRPQCAQTRQSAVAMNDARGTHLSVNAPRICPAAGDQRIS